MTWRTHIIGGATAGILLSAATSSIADAPLDAAIITSCSMLGSVLPDIDHTRSKLSRNDGFVGLVALLLSKVTKHRGFTHTIPGAALFAIIFYALAMFRTGKESLLAMFAALAVFMVLHATGDALRYLAGWMAVGVYTMGPAIADFVTKNQLSFGIDEHSARLCALGIFGGALSHIFYDAFNKGGVPVLWPISKTNFRLMTIRTNTTGELGFIALQIVILSAVMAVCFKDARAYEWLKDIVHEIRALSSLFEYAKIDI